MFSRIIFDFNLVKKNKRLKRCFSHSCSAICVLDCPQAVLLESPAPAGGGGQANTSIFLLSVEKNKRLLAFCSIAVYPAYFSMGRA